MFLSELNEMLLWMADVLSGYLEVWTKEKFYIVAGSEFGLLEGNVLFVDKAMYGLRSSRAQWVEDMQIHFENLGLFQAMLSQPY